MISKAMAKYVRVSPRKVRRVIDLIREESAQKALAILGNVNKVAAYHVAKVLGSAIANAKQKPDVKTEDLYISRITADGGPSLKRFKARAMGRATRILKRTCHITVELDKRKEVAIKPSAVSRQPKVKSKKPKAVSRKLKAR